MLPSSDPNLLMETFHKFQAKRFYDRIFDGKVLMVWGRTTAWVDENNPPAVPTINETEVEQVQGYKRPEYYYMLEKLNASVNPAEEIEVFGEIFKIENPLNYRNANFHAQYIYLEFDLYDTEGTLNTFRQIGIHDFFEYDPGAGYKDYYTEAEVTDKALIYMENSKPIDRPAGHRVKIVMLFKF